VFIPESQRYFVIPFLPYGPLPADIDGSKITSRKLGETPSDSQGEGKDQFFAF
jgi:hypothetical protein